MIRSVPPNLSPGHGTTDKYFQLSGESSSLDAEIFPHHSITTHFASEIRASDSLLTCGAFRQGQNTLFFSTIIEGMKPPDLVETTNGVERVEKVCVAGSKFARLQVTATQVRVAKCFGALPNEKVKTQPAAVGRGHA